MIRIHTIGGNTYNYKGSYQDIQRALRDIGCNYLVGHNRSNNRIIIPRASIDSVEEVELN